MYMKAKTLILATCLSAAACGGDDAQDPAAGESPPAQSCAALKDIRIDAASIGLPTRGARVESAAVVPASATNTAGEHCLVQGRIHSVDTAAQPIQFTLALPTQWNRKVVHLGGGGWNGFLPAPGGTVIGSALSPAPLASGYAVFGGDSGHVGLDPTFQLNAEQARNYGADHLKKTRDVAIEIIRLRYAAAPTRSYFAGGSNGGREALMVLQKWGQDYEGILAVYPAHAWTPTFLKMQQVGVAMRSGGGAGWINQAKALTLQRATVAACDALDGLADGIVSNLAACSFDHRALRCVGGADTGNDCFSDVQLATIDVLETPAQLPYALSNGITRAPAFNKGADWGGAIVGTDLPLGNTAAFNVPAGGGTPARSELGWVHWYGDGFTRYGLMQDPNANALSFDPLNPGPLLARLQEMSRLYDATNPDIQTFLRKGGKLLMVHGQSDQLVPAQPTIDYYQSVVQRFGQAEIDQAVRFYLIPGYSHVGGLAFNPVQGMNLFSALEAWVETGVAPQSLAAADLNPNANRRTRPLCRYPTWPRYNGSGSVDAASSFTCVSNGGRQRGSTAKVGRALGGCKKSLAGNQPNFTAAAAN